ncbi:MAG TPA: phosphatase PAP2 family protein [Candidatus Eisenbacteria bacterium]
MNRVLAMDRVMSAYNAALAAAWALLFRDLWPLWPALVALHAALAALPLLLRRIPERLPTPIAAIRIGYPILSLFPLWSELGWMHRLHLAPGHDAAIARIDHVVFGTHWNAAWRVMMPETWLNETMHGLYLAYYPILVTPALLAALLRRGEAFRDISFRLMLTYTACFAVYVFFPVYGPRQTGGPAGVPGGLFEPLMNRIFAAGDSPGTAFPSSHVAGAMTSAWLALRWLPRPVGVTLLLGAVGVAFATVYTGNHYAIDALGGILWAGILQSAVAPLFLPR